MCSSPGAYEKECFIADIENLSKQLEESQQAKADTDAELVETNKQLQIAKDKNNIQFMELHNTKGELKRAEKQNKELAERIDALCIKYSEAQKESVQTIKDHISEAHEREGQLQQAWQEQLKEIKQTFEEEQKRNVDLIRDSEAKLIDMKGELSNLDIACARQKEEIEQLTKFDSEQKSKIAALQNACAHFEGKVDSLESQLQQSNSELVAAKSHELELQKTIEKLQQQLKQKNMMSRVEK